jgi:hypothetical protein
MAWQCSNCKIRHCSSWDNNGAQVSTGIYIGSPTANNNEWNYNAVSDEDNQCGWDGAGAGAPVPNRNVFFGACTQPGNNRLNLDPLWINPGTDFHLQAGSPCIGHAVGSPTVLDFDEVTRVAPKDCGAYEYV